MDNFRYLLKLVINVINKKTRWIDTSSVQTITQGQVERHFSPVQIIIGQEHWQPQQISKGIISCEGLWLTLWHM